MAQVKQDILATRWQRGFTNLAQGFVLADTMFQQKGRGEAQSAVLVIWDGKYSFAFETGQKARMLKDKNTMIYMAPVAEQIGEDIVRNVKRWASQPWQTNFEHIPGLFELSTNEETYIQKVIVKFCPASFSPANFIKQDGVQGYTMIREGGRPHQSCSRKTDLGITYTVDECADLARQAGAQVFVTREKKQQGTMKFLCKSAPNYQTYVMSDYREYITKAVTGQPVVCPNGDQTGTNIKDGWTLFRKDNTYAIVPPFD